MSARHADSPRVRIAREHMRRHASLSIVNWAEKSWKDPADSCTPTDAVVAALLHALDRETEDSA